MLVFFFFFFVSQLVKVKHFRGKTYQRIQRKKTTRMTGLLIFPLVTMGMLGALSPYSIGSINNFYYHFTHGTLVFSFFLTIRKSLSWPRPLAIVSTWV